MVGYDSLDLSIDDLRKLRITRVRKNIDSDTWHVRFKYDGDRYVIQANNTNNRVRLFKLDGDDYVEAIEVIVECSWIFVSHLITRLRFKKNLRSFRDFNYGQVDLQKFLMVLIENGLVRSKSYIAQEYYKRKAEIIALEGTLSSLDSEAKVLITKHFGIISDCILTVPALRSEELMNETFFNELGESHEKNSRAH